MITTAIEALLFASAKPVTRSALQKALNVSAEVLEEALADIRSRFNTEGSGIHLLDHDGKVQLVSNPSQSEAIRTMFKQEMDGELTRPQLETLTIVAYRGPVTKPEIEQIRGINCSLILRNLLMRGLIEERESVEKLQPVYTLSPDFLRYLGVHAVNELPDYESLHANEKISELVQSLEAKQTNDEV